MKRPKKKTAPVLAWCARCRDQLPVGHVCPSANQADAAAGRLAVMSIRIDRRTREALAKLAAKRSEVQRWPRVTASQLATEAVRAMLKAEGLL